MSLSPCVGVLKSRATFYCRRPVPRLHTGGRHSASSREEHMDVFHAIVARLSVDFHHVVEAAGIVVLGLVFYSYSRRWLQSLGRVDWRLRSLAYGLVFGVLTIALMISRIEVGQGIFVDARALPIALVTLVEGGWAGVVAALVAAGYRASLGGGGATAGVVGLLATAGVAAALVTWARRRGGVRAGHAWALGGA